MSLIDNVNSRVLLNQPSCVLDKGQGGTEGEPKVLGWKDFLLRMAAMAHIPVPA